MLLFAGYFYISRRKNAANLSQTPAEFGSSYLWLLKPQLELDKNAEYSLDTMISLVTDPGWCKWG